MYIYIYINYGAAVTGHEYIDFELRKRTEKQQIKYKQNISVRTEGLHNNPKVEVHPRHYLTVAKEEEGRK
jgi:hypothetical protein